MYHRWRSLLFLHWAVPVDVLRPLVPSSLAIDTFEGRAYVGLVPFTMPYVRPRGMPQVPGAASFHETNVRTYVRPSGGGEPGVWFFSLDAASALAVAATRTLSPLLYFRADIALERKGDDVTYTLARKWPPPLPAAMSLRYTVDGARGERTAAPASLDEFLVERYALYAKRGATPLVRMRVFHRPYPLEDARVTALEQTLTNAAGIDVNGRAPDSVLYSPGVDVEIFRPELSLT